MQSINLKFLIVKSVKKLSEDLVFKEDTRMQFQSYIVNSDEVIGIWYQLNPVFEKFNGAADRFYMQMHQFCQPKYHLFSRLPKILSNLLFTELTTNCLNFLTAEKVTKESIPAFQWSEKLKSVVCYLAGYCFRTVFTQLHRSPRRNSSFSCQSIAILKAGKSDRMEEEPSEKLINVKDRGGLWRLKKDVVRIFEVCEEKFHEASQGFKMHFDAESVVENVRKNIIVRSCFNSLCRSVEFEFSKEVSANLLEKLLLLYVRIRCHSHARKIKEDHKMRLKVSKQKSLRTEIKRSTSSKEKGH